jgi:hypothetical protein
VILVEVKARSFRFSAGIPASVECLNCGWRRSQRWPMQRVFDLSIGHECEGVESYVHMIDRETGGGAS